MNLNSTTQLQARDITPKLSQGGFSLIELMIAMTIGLVILGAVVQIFVSSHATYQLDEGMSRVQEDARFSMDYLAKDIRMAGYLGCNSALFGTSAVNNIVSPSNLSTTFVTGGIRGYRYACTSSCTGNLSEWDPALPGDFFVVGEVKQGSDVVIIYRGSELGTTLTGNLATANANIQIVDTAAIAGVINLNDILLISDCSAADIFKATTISHPGGSGQYTIAHSAAGNTGPMLSKAYQSDARLMKLVSRAYYVATSAAGEPGLFLKELGTGALQPGQELVSDVESMKILYGVDTAATGSASQYVVPATVTDWTKVVSLRLGIIVRTPSTADTVLDTKQYDLLDDTVSTLDNFGPANDNRRRRVFNTTIRLRNH